MEMKCLKGVGTETRSSIMTRRWSSTRRSHRCSCSTGLSPTAKGAPTCWLLPTLTARSAARSRRWQQLRRVRALLTWEQRRQLLLRWRQPRTRCVKC